MADVRAFPRRVPPTVFDGRFHWYTEYVDPADDRCSLCRGPIGEDEVPLMLFKDVPAPGRKKPATWQARFCEPCAAIVIRFMRPH